ncbi:MAG: S-adenosylmethionine:tRNA ribosyltransferase-isomerase [Vicingaceae bacterium]
MNRADLTSEDFNYNLPEDRIAKYPLANRNQSKLLTYQAGKLGEDQFKNLKQYLPEESVLVFNDTKVLAARLYFRKKTGAKIEIFCLEPFESTVEQALSAKSNCKWQCLVGNLKRFKLSDILELEIAGTLLKASIIEKRTNDVIIQFEWSGGVEFSEILEEAGEIPLPPYLNRETELADQDNYQTVYAKTEGAVAAPTAGLHFVKPQLQQLQSQGHELAYLTLYVGAGTFRAVKTDKLVAHDIHEERIVISKSTIAQLADKKGKIISVGTTSLRSLESLYWLAVKMHQSNKLNERSLKQEDAYELPSGWTWKQACDFLLEVLEQSGENEIDFHSALFIMPSYQWKSIDGLITNFHQPKSTLLSLVAAWIGDDWKKVYAYAFKNDFRFLSYGDSSLLLR